MPSTTGALFERSRAALRTTQVRLGDMLGVSRRTAQRWSDHGVPGYGLGKLASLVYPHDTRLAAEIAAAAGTTVDALGLVPPPPPPAPAAPAALPPPPDGVVDAVVCAASDAMDMMPRDVRAGLHAAFARAKEIGLTVEMIERALRAQLPGPPPPAEAQVADKRKAARA